MRILHVSDFHFRQSWFDWLQLQAWILKWYASQATCSTCSRAQRCHCLIRRLGCAVGWKPGRRRPRFLFVRAIMTGGVTREAIPTPKDNGFAEPAAAASPLTATRSSGVGFGLFAPRGFRRLRWTDRSRSFCWRMHRLKALASREIARAVTSATARSRVLRSSWQKEVLSWPAVSTRPGAGTLASEWRADSTRGLILARRFQITS